MQIRRAGSATLRAAPLAPTPENRVPLFADSEPRRGPFGLLDEPGPRPAMEGCGTKYLTLAREFGDP
eukprot:9198966-Alexandrium_andersonii.AAC.1